MPKRYAALFARIVLVVLGVLAVLSAIGLAAAGVSYLVHHHGRGTSPVTTVTTTR